MSLSPLCLSLSLTLCLCSSNRPVLDESTSALDDDAAHEMLKECKILNITLVAVVHHHSAYEKVRVFVVRLHV